MNGTPMPSFAESLTDEERWQLVDFITALDPRDGPGYAELVQVTWTTDEIELDLAQAGKLFESAPPAYFPVVGQITEPGRAFHPGADGVTVRALYNAREIGFLVTWHDMRADVEGRNAPDIKVPPEEDEGEAPAAAASEGEGGDSVWGDEEAPAGDAGADAAAAGEADVWGDDAAPAAEEGAQESGGDFWGEEEGGAAAVTPTTEFSDAFALQLPAQLPTGNRKPYFLFGDAQNPVDLWFVDLATKVATRYNGAGSASLSVVEGEEVSAVAAYDRGEWSVLLKRPLRGTGGVTFAEGQYVPVAFSIWDGYQRERGNKRGLTQWMYLYTMPKETPSTVWPMLRAALAVLAVEILLISWVRRRRRHTPVSQDREVPLHV